MKKALLLVCLLFMAACHRGTEPVRVSETQIKAAPAETPHEPASQPTEAEVRAALKRNYADAVILDHSLATPFLVGDFNGDNSEDIAIIVKPRSGKVSELNSEFANWILEDPQHVRQISHDVRVNDTLLAVIHGNDREGWRNDLARQTYLLKNAVGTEPAMESIRQIQTSSTNRSLPQLRGDVIREKLSGSGGIIYWTGAKYAWHPVS
jgi:hypothetical protein